MVRAEPYLQLITKYGYSVQRIDVEVPVPRRTPSDLADIVGYTDDERKSLFIIVECKKQTVSEAEFVQAVEQGFSDANSLRAECLWVTSSLKSKNYDVKNSPDNKRTANIIAAVPRLGQSKLGRMVR